MAFFDDLKKKYTELLSPVKQSLTSLGNSVNDNQGWYRNGQFTPVKQIQSMVAPTSLGQTLSNPNLGQNVGDYWRNTNAQGVKIGNTQIGGGPVFTALGNFGGNTVQSLISGAQQTAKGLDQTGFFGGKSNPISTQLQGLVKIGMGAAKVIAPFTPLYNVANAVASNPNGGGADLPRRVSAGLLGGMTGLPLAPNVPDINTNLGPLGSVDLAKTAGSLYGFTKNPLWKTIFGKTSPIAEAKWLSNPVTNYLATRGTKGSLEGLIQGLGDMPDNLTTAQKAEFIAKNVLFGAGSEIAFDLASKKAGELGNRVWNGESRSKAYSQAYDMLRDVKGRFAKASDSLNYPTLKSDNIAFIKDFESKYNVPDSELRPKPYPTAQELNRYKDLVDTVMRVKQGGYINFGEMKPKEVVSGKIKIKPTLPDNLQTGAVVPTDLQTNLPSTVKQSITGPVQPKSKLNLEVPPAANTFDKSIPRGFTESVQEAPNVLKKVKAKVSSTYVPKPNDQLMGEAKALLESGATIDFKNTQGLDKKVAATIQEAINQQKAGNHEASANLYNNLSEHGTELGRGVQAFSMLQKMSPEAIALSAAGKIKKYNLANPRRPIPELNGDQVKMIADKVQAIDLLKGREKNIALNELGQIVNSFIPSSLGDKAIAVWKAGLLTSLRTHERNFVGNTIHGAMEVLKDIPATAADIALSARTGKRSTTFTVKGLGEFGSKSTRQQMADIVAKGFDPSQTIDKFDYKQITWGKNPIEQTLKKYTDVVFRTLGASDKPFYNSAMARSLYDQAGTEAINAGKRGNTAFIENLVKNPTEQMVKVAINDANVATFKTKNAASAVANAIKKELGKVELLRIAGEVTLPFTGVPSSIAGQILNYSPVGLLKGIYKVGDVAINNLPDLQRQAVQELGRGVVGTGIFGLGAYLMSKGIITGQPKDAEEARLWDSQNKPRNSIMIGGKYRSLNSIGPEAVVLLAGAKLNEEINKPEGSAGQYITGLGKDYLDQSFVQGLQAPVNAVTDPQRYGKSYLGQLVGSPIPNIVKDVARGLDPNQREANTVKDYAKLGIPGLRNTMIEKRDVLGNVMKQEPTGLAAGLDLFNSKTPIKSPIVDELARLYAGGTGATPSKLTPSQTILKQKVKLTYDQLNNLEAGVGDLLRPRLDQLMSDPNYQRLSDEEKSSIIDKVVQDTRLKYKNTNASQFGVTPTGGYVDTTGNFKQIDTTPISPPKLTGNKTIDDKLALQYKNDLATQATNLAKSTQATTPGTPQNTYSYVDENGAYKTVNLDPVKYPTMTGNDVVDKKLKSAYYSSINAQINDVIKLGQSGQLTQDQMIKMVTDLNTQYNKGKVKKPKKISLKKPKVLKLKAIKIKKIKMPKIKKVKKLKMPKRVKLRV